MQGTWVRALVWEDPTCRGATRPMSHNYWACASGACAPQRKAAIVRGPRTAMKSGPRLLQLEKALAQKWRSNTAKNINKKKNKNSWLVCTLTLWVLSSGSQASNTIYSPITLKFTFLVQIFLPNAKPYLQLSSWHFLSAWQIGPLTVAFQTTNYWSSPRKSALPSCLPTPVNGNSILPITQTQNLLWALTPLFLHNPH